MCVKLQRPKWFGSSDSASLLCFSHKLYGGRGNQHGAAMFRLGFLQGIIFALLAPIIAEKGTELDAQLLQGPSFWEHQADLQHKSES